MPLAWDHQTQISSLFRQFCVLKLFKSRRPYSAESVTCFGQHAFIGTPGAVERCSRPYEGHVILQANPRDLARSQLV